MMTQSPDPSTTTFDYYDKNAQRFFDGTVNIDMTSLYQPFLDLLPQTGKILDAGCGSGRDTRFFILQGFKVVAFDYAPEIVKLASEYVGQDVLLLSYEDIGFQNLFDGVWACSSLLHVPKNDMRNILARFVNAMRDNGILYTSFKYGTEELVRNGRLFVDYTETEFDQVLGDMPTVELVKYWQTNDLRPGRSEEKWLNILVRKV